MKIALLGSTGFLGKHILKHALDEGHEIRALVRLPEKLEEFIEQVEYVQGDYFKARSISETLKGCQVVVSAIAPAKNIQPTEYKKALRNLVNEMKGQGIDRLIQVSEASVKINGSATNFATQFIRLKQRLFNYQKLKIRDLEAELISNSALAWILIRPQKIECLNYAELKVNAQKLYSKKVDVDSLAQFIISQLQSKQWIHKAPLVSE